MRAKFVYPYEPAVRRRFYSRYRNGITLWVGKLALHIWNPRDA